MPEDNPAPEKQSEPEKTNGDATVIQAIPVPSSPPPDTKIPIQFNQQVNVYQIPQNAWDRLTPVQVMELTKVILDQADATDKRHFEFATEQAKRDDSGKAIYHSRWNYKSSSVRGRWVTGYKGPRYSRDYNISSPYHHPSANCRKSIPALV